MRFKSLVLLLMLGVLGCGAFAQSCPGNIGFEDGTFNGWTCYTGTLETSGIQPPVWSAGGGPTAGRHTILQNSSPQMLDPYGNFPVNSPNGSKYSMQLGNSSVAGGGGGFCEKATYNFTVPSDDFTLIYYYAVVFENPTGHTDAQQPQFIANVNNIDNPSDVICGSFSFTASAGLDGFKKAGGDIYYKPWSPITIRIIGKKGTHYQLEFITRDCSKGGHFGYAYLDFDENCGSPITGNNYCNGTTNTLTLTAPAGFQSYMWFDAKGDTLSTTPTLKISPIPADGTVYSIHITPYAGLGCDNTFTTTVHKVDEPFNLQVLPSMAGCKLNGIDLTKPEITAGSVGVTKLEYYTDPDAQNFLSDPKFVIKTGDYYIRGLNDYGCTDIQKIHLDLYEGPPVHPGTPKPICGPATFDLTTLITPDPSEPDVAFAWYSDVGLKTPVPNPKSTTQSGRYYVTVTSKNPNECVASYYFDVVVSYPPIISPKPWESCPPLDLTKAISNADGSGIVYDYYYDAAGTKPIADPTKIMISGVYYYQAFNQYGCSGNISTITATVDPIPVFKVTDPMPVVYPITVDLTTVHPALSYAHFTYWKDSTCTQALDNYLNIDVSGTYYIKATNDYTCEVVHPVHVLVNEPPQIDLIAGNTFTPNGDGVNDLFTPQMQGVGKLDYIKIFNRLGHPVFQISEIGGSWDGTIDGQQVPAGTYYWVFSAYDLYRKKTVRKGGSITVLR